MILKRLYLQDFRNHSRKTFEFSLGINLVVGPNAIGKTNILEAVYLLATGKSFRVKTSESEMITHKEEIGKIRGLVEKTTGDIELEILLTTGQVMGQKVGRKKYLVNQVAKRTYDFTGQLKAVYFGPEDLELITDSPGLRRRYLDAVLSQVDREYGRASLAYEKGLRSRNKLLEEMRECGLSDKRRLFFWDQLLIKNGDIVSVKRQEYLDFLNRQQDFKDIGAFSLEYDRSVISTERLQKYEQQEIACGATLVGPHRDDFKFKIKTQSGELRDLSIFGSRGEQRLAILWLKIGETAFIEERTQSKPVMLLDDIFSELDVEHRELVTKAVGDKQTIITTADLGMIEKEWLDEVTLIEL